MEEEDDEEDPFRDPVLEDEDLDELDDVEGLEEGRNDGAPPMFMSVGATLSCAGGVYVGKMIN